MVNLALAKGVISMTGSLPLYIRFALHKPSYLATLLITCITRHQRPPTVAMKFTVILAATLATLANAARTFNITQAFAPGEFQKYQCLTTAKWLNWIPDCIKQCQIQANSQDGCAYDDFAVCLAWIVMVVCMLIITVPFDQLPSLL
jgi:hypothetical protein